MLLNSAVKSQAPLTSPSVAKSASPANSLSPVTSLRWSGPVSSGYSGNYISSLAFSDSDARLAIADNPKKICLWDIAARRCTATFMSEWSVAFSPDGKLLAAVNATGSGANIISLWNVATGQPTPLRNPKSQGAYSVACSPDNKTLAAADANGTTYLWNVVTHKPIVPLSGPQGQSATSVAFSRAGNLLAVGYSNGSTYLWNVVTHKLIVPLSGPQGQNVNSVAFSRAGNLLAVGYENGSTYLWNAVTDKLIAPLRDSQDRNAYSVAFSPDGRLLAVGDTNGSIYVWNVAARKWLRTLGEPNSGPHPNSVDSVVFSPSGRILAAGYHNGSVYLWYIGLRLSIVRINAPPLYGHVTLLMSGHARARSAACCSSWAILRLSASMSAGARGADCCQVCSPGSSDRPFSSCRTRALRRAARSCAASRSAWSEARVTTGPGVCLLRAAQLPARGSVRAGRGAGRGTCDRRELHERCRRR